MLWLKCQESDQNQSTQLVPKSTQKRVVYCKCHILDSVLCSFFFLDFREGVHPGNATGPACCSWWGSARVWAWALLRCGSRLQLCLEVEDQRRAAGDQIKTAPVLSMLLCLSNLVHAPLFPVVLMFEDALMQGQVLSALFSIIHFILGEKKNALLLFVCKMWNLHVTYCTNIKQYLQP